MNVLLVNQIVVIMYSIFFYFTFLLKVFIWKLYLSQDYGANWRLISNDIYVYTWGNAGKRAVPPEDVRKINK